MIILQLMLMMTIPSNDSTNNSATHDETNRNISYDCFLHSVMFLMLGNMSRNKLKSSANNVHLIPSVLHSVMFVVAVQSLFPPRLSPLRAGQVPLICYVLVYHAIVC